MLKKCWQLFKSFFAIGGLTFGGGYSMLPMMQREVVERYGWCSEEELIDYFAVAQSIPGLIAANTATFVGRKVAGTWGSVCAVFGVALPSFVIISVIAGVLTNVVDVPVVAHAFAGIRVAVAALIFASILKMWKSGIKDTFGLVLFIVALGGMFFLDSSPILCVLGGIACGLCWGFLKRRVKE